MAKPLTIVIIFLLVLITIVQLTTLYYVERSSAPHARSYTLPKVIWIYWDSTDLPPIIEQIRDYNKPSLADWTVHFLNNASLSSYIPASAYPSRYETLITAHKSDWLRIYLLSTYGGCWMDAGIVINNPAAMNDLYNEALISQADLTCFQTTRHTFVHRTGKTLPKLIDNWFIMVPKDSLLISLWRQEYEKAIEMGFINYKRATVNNGIDISAINFENDDDVYLTQHICIQAVIQNPQLKPPPLLIKQSSDSMFKVQDECNGNMKCFADHFNNDPNVKKLPYIKLSRYERKVDLTRFFEQQA